MSKSQLRKEISELAQILADAVVKAISSRSLSELADITEGREPAKPRSAPKAPPPAKRASNKATKPAPKKPAAAKPPKARVTPAEVRAGVLAALKESKEWMKAAAIVAAMKNAPAPELLNRVLRQLMIDGHVVKQGATRNTEYQITASGLAL